MDIRDYERILDAIPATGIYVVREDNHEILYFNSQVQEMVPEVRRGMVCDKLWVNSCANCPLLNIGDKAENRSVSCDSSIGRAVDMVAKRILWQDEIPAFVISVTPHIDEVSHV